MSVIPEQYYLFTVPGDELVWCEMFTAEGHYVAPTPHAGMVNADAHLRELHPGTTVDMLCDAGEIETAQRWARECPLEPLPV